MHALWGPASMTRSLALLLARSPTKRLVKGSKHRLLGWMRKLGLAAKVSTAGSSAAATSATDVSEGGWAECLSAGEGGRSACRRSRRR
eukprot:7919607-Pyramimonas_sp.AAC.1